MARIVLTSFGSHGDVNPGVAGWTDRRRGAGDAVGFDGAFAHVLLLSL